MKPDLLLDGLSDIINELSGLNDVGKHARHVIPRCRAAAKASPRARGK